MSFQDKTRQYQKLATETSVAGASPHRLIQMLFEGALQALARAQGAMDRNDMTIKGEQLSKAIEIVGGLRGALNSDEGELPYNLDRLYEYIQLKLVEANQKNDARLIIEAVGLLQTLKEGWDGIQPS